MKEEGKGNNFPLNLFHLHQEQGGTQRTLVDAAGQPLYAWDAEDRKTEIIYDELRRPLKRIINDKELERYIYGEGLANDKVNNLRGQLYQHYDGSGLQQINAYDFNGNPLETEQQLLEDATLSDADWNMSPNLSAEAFISAITYDALSRPITQTDPGGNVQAFTYDKGGLLKSVKLNNENYVNDIHYDAKGQRQAIWYGNGTKTSYTYDPETYRLRRLLTVNLNNNEILQDLHYWYDPIGNITEIQDDAQQTLFFNNSVVNPRQQFTYDAIYRLIQAQGRELIGTATFGIEDNWNDAAWQTTQKGDGNAVQNYTQLYTYDAVGNILELQHIATAGSYTRTYAIATDSNQLLSTIVGSATYTYQYDAKGNMTEMPHLDGMHWNLNNELHQIENGTMQAYYQYSGGQRIRKYVDKGSVKEERIYLGNFEIYRKFDHASSLVIERTTVQVSDDTGRIAMLEMRTFGSAADDNDTAESLERYVYSNHLQSASLELCEDGAIISYEEYHPYGTTSYQAMNASIHAVAKRYRYTGKERDEESGLYMMGARYYICWLGRWASVDALQDEMPDWSPYNYGFCNPVVFNDPSGNQPEGDDAQKQYEAGEKRTQAMFQSKLDEVANSKVIEDFKSWFADFGLEGLVSFRDALYESKLKPYQEHWLSESLYGRESNGEIAVPYEIRKRLWNEAINETVPTLKASWAALMTGKTSGILFTHYKNLTISNREEGWDAIKSAGITVGIQWALHLSLGGFSNLAKTATSLAELSAAFQLARLEKSISGAHFLSRHGAQTTLKQQFTRATTGLTPDGVLKKPIDASRFLSHELELKAVKQAEFIHKTTGATSFRFDMGKTIGEGYIKGGSPLIKTSKVQATFVDGKLITMFPKLR